MTIKRLKTNKDGTTTLQTPHRYENGKYRVVIEVAGLDDIERLLNSGEAIKVRMSGDDGQVNVCKPDGY